MVVEIELLAIDKKPALQGTQESHGWCKLCGAMSVIVPHTSCMLRLGYQQRIKDEEKLFCHELWRKDGHLPRRVGERVDRRL